MRKWRLVLAGIFALLLFWILASPPRVAAQICYPSRIINQWACLVTQNCTSGHWGCSANPSRSCVPDATTPPDNCNAGGPYPFGQGPCTYICDSWTTGSSCLQTGSYTVACSAAPSCQATVDITTCSGQTTFASCSTNTQTLTYGCWGPGPPPPVTPGPTPTPAPCGNGICEVSEDCITCAVDCGSCPPVPTATPTPGPPLATINARAVAITRADTSCAAVVASTNYLNGTVFSAAPALSPAAQTQSGGAYVGWNNVSPSTYTLIVTPPSGNSALANGCYTKTGGAPYTQSMSAVVNGGETVTWNVGFTPPGPWVQTQGGDVYAATTLSSLLPETISPRQFNLIGTGNFPGIVIYGSGGVNPYDFDIASGSYGETLVSGTNWLVNDAYAMRDFYQLFYVKFGAPTTPDYTNPTSPLAKPASRSAPYYVQGDMTTGGDWSVAPGENIVFLVDGNLTIGGKINLTGTGFVGFIVRGNITVLPAVGGAATSAAPAVEGVYLTSGTFATGGSSNPGTEKLVGKGMFVANAFLLQRDLESVGQNANYPAELFSYNPQLLLTMPAQMKDVPIIWEEVAP